MTRRFDAFREALAGKLVLGILLLGFAGWTAVSIFQRSQAVWAQPDLNGDGKFSILDVPRAAGSIAIEVGRRYQAVLAKTKVGRFLEMRLEDPNVIWSIALAAFTYFLIGGWTVLLFERGTTQDDP